MFSGNAIHLGGDVGQPRFGGWLAVKVAWNDLRLLIVVWALADGEICFELRHGETFPRFGLVQERPALEWTEGRSLTAQRSCGAISTHVFHNDFPVHEHEFVLPPLCRQCGYIAQERFSIG
jgi:hypothetical protein